MLLLPVELRKQSHVYQEASRNAVSGEAKRQLAAYAFALAQIAEGIEREERQGRNRDFFDRFLADALSKVLEVSPSELQALTEAGRDRAAAAGRDRIKLWRARAE